jgi:aminoglycoside phosphotransferase (APT) family kinase protein
MSGTEPNPRSGPAAAFDPSQDRARVEAYLGRWLGGKVRLRGTRPLERSTREAPWRLDATVEGQPRAYVLRLASRRIEHEYQVMRAVESLPLPTPRAFGWDPGGEALGVPCFFYEFVDGASLLPPMLAGEAWAEALYVETVCTLQSVTRAQLGPVAERLGKGETAADVLEEAHAYFRDHDPQPLAEAAYARLRETQPSLPETRFSNGDLWPDNLLARDRRLVGIIDWALAGFSDPIFEFLLPFFLRPSLRGRGLEAGYCRRMGFDPGLLPWYHGLEFFDSWRWVQQLGEPYEQHTDESLAADLARWLEENG